MVFRDFAIVTVLAMVWASAFPTAVVLAQDANPNAGQTPGSTSTPSGRRSPWLIVPVVSSSPKLGTSGGGLGAYLKTFDEDSRVSLFGVTYQYTSTESSIAGAFARMSFGADHHRVVVIAGLGYIKNDYEDYLGTGQPLKTDDDMQAVAARYLYRAAGDWFMGAHGTATNYQVLGATPEDDLVLETLGLRGFSSAAIGAVAMHDSRDSEDMPSRGWFVNVNNLAHREAFGGTASYDAYRADFKAFVPHGGGHVLGFRQFNWVTDGAPAIGQATVILRGYKFGQYLAPYMSSLEAEERLSFGRRWGATVFAGMAGLYGEESTIPVDRHVYPMWGAGLQFIIKPEERMLVNFEYAEGVENNHGLYLKFGYGW